MGAPLLRVPALVVLSGGAIGAGAARHLLRAIRAGRLRAERIVVVDRDPACEAARLQDPRIEMAVADWTEWLLAHLDRLDPASHLVPYHWAPHVLVDWLARQVEARGTARRGGAVPEMGTPVDRATREGDRALSYATWICPPTCIEPRLCPHTRAPKDWSLAADLEGSRIEDDGLERIVFRCLHLVWGVGTVPVAEILRARDHVLAGLVQGARRYLIATSSHCHALATTLEVAPWPPPEGGSAGGGWPMARDRSEPR
jgi:hypothetical protein